MLPAFALSLWSYESCVLDAPLRVTTDGGDVNVVFLQNTTLGVLGTIAFQRFDEGLLSCALTSGSTPTASPTAFPTGSPTASPT
eukprot:scaffold4827_cov186-Pinguiococcus_pyrenoidosus.AAC.1